MPFSRPTLTTLIDRIEADITSRLTDDVALLRRALLKILARVWAGAAYTIYGFLDYISVNILVDKAETDWLDRHGFLWGRQRINETFADGDVIFTGTSGTIIPINTKLVRTDGIEFRTTVADTISGGTVTINVEAIEAGADGNTDAGVLLALSSPISGVNDTGEVDTGLDGGVDQETDEELRERILLRIQTPPAGGAAHDYRDVSRQVAGVAEAYVYGNQNVLVATPGHVTVVILGISPKVPSASLLTDVEDALTDPETGIVPVTATLHVEPITIGQVEMDISIKPNTADLKTEIFNNIDELFDNEGTPGGTVLLSRIRDAIAVSGVDDYEITDIELNSVSIGVNNIDLDDFDFPVLSNIVWSTLP